MAPSTRVLMLAQMGFVLQDWDELGALGETATQRRASADTLAVKIARWKAVEMFVCGYSGVARAFGALDFSCTEHDEWCWLVTSQVDQGTSNGTLTRPPEERLHSQVCEAPWRSSCCRRLVTVDGASGE